MENPSFTLKSYFSGRDFEKKSPVKETLWWGEGLSAFLGIFECSQKWGSVFFFFPFFFNFLNQEFGDLFFAKTLVKSGDFTVDKQKFCNSF